MSFHLEIIVREKGLREWAKHPSQTSPIADMQVAISEAFRIYQSNTYPNLVAIQVFQQGIAAPIESFATNTL